MLAVDLLPDLIIILSALFMLSLSFVFLFLCGADRFCVLDDYLRGACSALIMLSALPHLAAATHVLLWWYPRDLLVKVLCDTGGCWRCRDARHEVWSGDHAFGRRNVERRLPQPVCFSLLALCLSTGASLTLSVVCPVSRWLYDRRPEARVFGAFRKHVRRRLYSCRRRCVMERGSRCLTCAAFVGL